MVRLRPNYDPYGNAKAKGAVVHIYRIPAGSGSGAGGSPPQASNPTWVAGDSAVVLTEFGCLNQRKFDRPIGCDPHHVDLGRVEAALFLLPLAHAHPRRIVAGFPRLDRWQSSAPPQWRGRRGDHGEGSRASGPPSHAAVLHTEFAVEVD